MLNNERFKFRIWDISNQTYIKGVHITDLIYRDNHYYHKYVDVDGYKIVDVIIEQFSGILDSRGEELYEGDIVTIGESYPKWMIEFNTRTGAFTASGYSINTNSGTCVSSHSLVKIGTVSENGYLLLKPKKRRVRREIQWCGRDEMENKTKYVMSVKQPDIHFKPVNPKYYNQKDRFLIIPK